MVSRIGIPAIKTQNCAQLVLKESPHTSQFLKLFAWLWLIHNFESSNLTFTAWSALLLTFGVLVDCSLLRDGETIKEMKRSDGLWRFACGDVLAQFLTLQQWWNCASHLPHTLPLSRLVAIPRTHHPPITKHFWHKICWLSGYFSQCEENSSFFVVENMRTFEISNISYL